MDFAAARIIATDSCAMLVRLLHYTHQKRSKMQKGAFSLTRQANILSFDDAKRGSAARGSASVRENGRVASRDNRRNKQNYQAGQSNRAYSSSNQAGHFDRWSQQGGQESNFAYEPNRMPSASLSDYAYPAQSSRSFGGFDDTNSASAGRTMRSTSRNSSVERGRSVRGENSTRSGSTGSARAYRSTSSSRSERVPYGNRTSGNRTSHSTRDHRFAFDDFDTFDSLGDFGDFDGFGASDTRNRSSRDARATRTQSSPRSAILSYDEFLSEEEQAEDGDAQGGEASRKNRTFLQKLSDKKQKRAKEKAGRAYDRQFGDASSAAAANAGPRAAVYKGEMGPSQRRAQRMQPNASNSRQGSYRAAHAASHENSGIIGWIASAAGSVSNAVTSRFLGDSAAKKAGLHAQTSGFSADGRSGRAQKQGTSGNLFSKITSALFGTRRRVAALSVAACLVIAGAFMYPAAKQYYTEMRHLDKVNAEYQAVTDRNADLAATRDYLQSETGIEEMAHEKYGWVNEGEHSVLVYGLPDDGTMADTNLYIKRGSVSAPETWYSVILDPLFGVE